MGIFKSSTFRLAVGYACLFGVSATAVLSFIYWSTAGYMARQTDITIQTEVEGLAERYRGTNLNGLVELLDRRVASSRHSNALYLLMDPALRPIVGNLDRWPDTAPDDAGWLNFDLERAASEGNRGARSHPARARTFILQDGYHLLVGRDVRELTRTRQLIARTLGWGIGLTAVLGLAGGWVMSRSTARRLEAINETGREIMQGDLSRRVPTDGSDDDFDQLAVNLNLMLGRIQGLMEDVKQVSDNVAHDLRTPLTRLRQRLETLRSERDTSPATAVAIDRALGETNELLATFSALLRIARIESGERRAHFDRVALASVIEDAAELYEPVAEQRGQTMTVDLNDTVAVEGDRHLLFQAFANVLDNAVKYTPNGGEVRVTIGSRDGHGRVTISDTGPGIPPTMREQVFKRFSRLEQSRPQPGNGLGLALVAAVAKLHRAKIALTGEGSGLSVHLDFPPYQPAPLRAA